MGSFDRSRRGIQLWKKALIQYSLCFFMGFFIGFAPSGTASIFSSQAAAATYKVMRLQAVSTEAVHAVYDRVDPESQGLNMSSAEASTPTADSPEASDESRVASGEKEEEAPAATDGTAATAEEEVKPQLSARRLLILVTTTRLDDPLQDVLLRRLGHTLRLVPPPLLWVVVESERRAPRTAEMLRKTGVMYRHLVFKENFTDPAAEVDHQRNVALKHIRNHHLDGIVHFAGLPNVYDLQFFDVIRETEALGMVWPVAEVSATRKRAVALECPHACRSSSSSSDALGAPEGGEATAAGRPRVDASGFAFNSSILWDTERWGRPTPLPDTPSSQDPFKFVQQVLAGEESKSKWQPPPDCSRVLVWRLHIPITSSSPGVHASAPLDQKNVSS